MAASTPYQPPRIQTSPKLPPKVSNSRSRAHILQATCLWLKAVAMSASRMFGDHPGQARRPAGSRHRAAMPRVRSKARSRQSLLGMRLGSVVHGAVVCCAVRQHNASGPRWISRRSKPPRRQKMREDSRTCPDRRRRSGRSSPPISCATARISSRSAAISGRSPLSDPPPAFGAVGRSQDAAARGRRAQRPALPRPPYRPQVPGDRLRRRRPEATAWSCSAIR